MRTSVPVESKTAGRVIKRVCVFCGSSLGCRPVYREAAAQLGSLLAHSGIALVYGGGRVGLMGVLADSVLQAGGEVIGVMPRALVEKEIAHTSLTELRVVESMHERKALMADWADAFVLLPGGFGSWEEFCEVVTWLQLGMHRKPCAVLNVDGYYDALMRLVAHAVSEGFLHAAHQEMVIVEDNAEQLLSQLSTAQPPTEAKWASNRGR
ncbi:MAG: TIGR00730 family Rossman fold protein [Candidatus Acidiferrales bacterium]